jgi:hypothetical protein
MKRTPEKTEKEVQVSNEFGRLKFDPVQVPRPGSDYGWNGESFSDFRHSDQKVHDEKLRDEVLDTLVVDLNLDFDDSQVEVDSGHVIISGNPSDFRMKERIEAMIGSLSGVKSVKFVLNH